MKLEICKLNEKFFERIYDHYSQKLKYGNGNN